MSDLNTYREEIDSIDSQIIEFFNKRFEVVKKVGMFKKENNMPALQPGRWQEVLDKRINQAKEFGLGEEFIKDIWNRMHDYALDLEDKELKSI